ncbi:MAG: DUF2835 family protein [Halomonadaceae bacterium]|nr:MAG: DUF2835 family protein [Halomonadaceae bacterium]
MPADVIVVDVAIPREEWLRIYYDGSGKNLRAKARDGRSVVFPANILHPFISHEGVHGCFMITFDDSGRFEAVSQLG